MQNNFLYFAGIFVGFLSLPGWISDVEIIVWIALAVFSAIYFANPAPKSNVLKALGLAFSWALGCGLIQTLFFKTYASNNPGFITSLEKLPEIFPAQLMPLIGAPFTALGLGLFLWLSLSLVQKFK